MSGFIGPPKKKLNTGLSLGISSLSEEPREEPPRRMPLALSFDSPPAPAQNNRLMIDSPPAPSLTIGSPVSNYNPYQNDNTELIPENTMLEYIETANINNDFIRNKMIEIHNNVNSSNRSEIKNKIIENISDCPNPFTHGNRRFINLVGGYDSPIHVSYVCTSPNSIFKLVNCQTHYISDFTMIKEIAFQYYAKYLSSNDPSDDGKCEFTVPGIISYGRLVINSDEFPEIFNLHRRSSKYGLYGKFNCFWFIEMERLKYDSLYESLKYIDLDNEEICNKLSAKIKKLETCLKSKDFFHNDYHAENIFYNRENDEVGLIDYGISDLTGNLDTRAGVNYDCELLKNIKKGKKEGQIAGRKYKNRTRRRYKKMTKRRRHGKNQRTKRHGRRHRRTRKYN